MQAQFIVIEGLDGAGKSTAIAYVERMLLEAGISDIRKTREPGGTPVAEAIRDVINQEFPTDTLCASAELLLMYASRLQVVETVIKPAMANEQWILGDRHELSTRAYQGGGRNIPEAIMACLHREFLGRFGPDFTLYLDIAPELALQRARERGKLGRIENAGLDFFQRVRDTYLRLLRHIPNSVIIDASQPLPQVETAVLNALQIQYPSLLWPVHC